MHARRRVAPRRPAARIRRAVWSLPISWPARRAASHSLRAPYTPKFALHSSLSAAVIAAWRQDRADAGLDFAP